ncbi:MAG: hypothetical protein QGI21_01825 [Candidatus Poseidoniaceae archaeon]|nr:hypothetical protein [Candidatus Poseidoniaceae archaeon]
MVPSASADFGSPEQLQAQDISVSFDPVSETTTVTWRNIESTGGNLDLYEDLWDATYYVYRHNAPITTMNVGELIPWHSVVACDKNDLGENPLACRGQGGSNPHPGHTAIFQVGAGTNGSFYYGVITEFANGSLSQPLDFNASSLYDPVLEITTPIRTPYNIAASFNPSTSKTTISWINYNTINPVLPEFGADAFSIHIWQTDYAVTRDNGQNMITTETPIATLGPTESSYELNILPNTNREVYYSVTYFLPNWTMEGGDYEDSRFLSNNAMAIEVLEDNTPPTAVVDTTAFFTPDENGTGITTISWTDVPGETGEVYKIYRHGDYFTNVSNPYVQLVGTVSENVNMYEYNIPFNTFGDFVYCIVVEDQYGATDTMITMQSCDQVTEDADENWVKEPTNVQANFLGNGITRVTWSDQVGVEGERYHIWRALFRVTGSQFTENTENASMYWMGSVPDGIERFDVELPENTYTDSAHYFVTTEALYNCPGCNGTSTYRELVNNWDGPIIEDTETPTIGRISDVQMIGGLNVVNLEWIDSSTETGESYTIYRHFDDPFGSSEFATSNYTDEGWEYVEGPFTEDQVAGFSTFVRQVPVPEETERDVWYAIIIADSFGNINPEILPGFGGNAVQIREDTLAPSVTWEVRNEESVPIAASSLVRGDYTIRAEVSEQLFSFPVIWINSSSGSEIIAESTMILISDNMLDPEKGPEFFQAFSISSAVPSGEMTFEIEMVDMSTNSVTQTISGLAVDAKSPTIDIFSPTEQGDGAKYLYGEDIKVIAAASDDVGIISMKMRFIQNYGTSSAVTEPWRNVTGLEVSDDGDWIIQMSFSSGNFLPGLHEVSVKATDEAGNERTERVKFITDFCRHRWDGETICEYSNPVPDEPEVIYPELNATDPPYMVGWISAGASGLSMLIMLLVIASAMKGPKKKKDDDDEDDNNWMAEFIGTSSDPDMDLIAGVSKPEEEKKSESAIEDDEKDDPFAVNITQPKRRRKKSKDEDEDEDDDDEKESKKKRKKSPKRRKPARRKKDD